MLSGHNAGQQQPQQSSSISTVVGESALQQAQPRLPHTTATTTANTINIDGNTNNDSSIPAVPDNILPIKRVGNRRPCVALSQNIMCVYRLINNKYSEERRRRQPGVQYNDGYDDRHGHYIAYTGEEIWKRYTVQGVLGRGSFGTVLKCFDEKHREQVAVKVFRNGGYFYDQGLVEVDIVAKLNNIPALDNLVVRLRKVFVWKNHLVLVFEMLSMNLFQLIQRTNYNGVSLDLTRKFAYQLVLVLKQLEEHNPPIIHCDVKPENVVLRDPSRSSIRLIDFGSACFLHEGAKLYKYVQSRFYRSVEVILELGYDTAIDRWSLGCMLVELHTGVPLFPGRDEVDQIARFTAVLGPVPDEMIERSHKKDVFFYDYRHPHPGASLQQSAVTMTGEDSNMNSCAHPVEHTASPSPSPVIAAEVLHSLSMTSSISAVTATSAAAVAAARTLAAQTDAVSATATISAPPPLPPPPPPPPPPQQQQQATTITTASTAATTTTTNTGVTGVAAVLPSQQQYASLTSAPESWQLCKNSSVIHGGRCSANNANNNSSGNSAAVVPTLHRPRTAITTAVFSSKDHSSQAAIEAEGTLTPAAPKRHRQSTGNKQPQQPPKLQAAANATSTVRETVLPAPRHHTGPRPSALTPMPRLTTSGQGNTHSEPSVPFLTKAGRAGQPPTAAAAGVEQQQQQQMGPLPQRSPFVLRVPPTSEQRQTLEEIIGVYTGGPRGCRRGQVGHGVSEYMAFLDFVKRLLCYDPRKRMSCIEALQHPFLLELETQKQWKYLNSAGVS